MGQRMKILFVGTGSGKTSLERFHSSILIETQSKKILVDAGDSISRALLSRSKNPNDVDVIVISHFHADHFAGLPSLLTQMYLGQRTKPLEIFAHDNYVDFTNELLRRSYLFPEKLPFEIEINGYSFDVKYSLTEGLEFKPLRNSHIKKRPVLTNYPDKYFVSSSFVFEAGHRKLLYTSDLGGKEDIELFNEKYNVVVIEYTHIEFSSIIELFKKSNPEKMFITHVDEEKLNGLMEEINSLPSELGGKIIIADDGTEFEF